MIRQQNVILACMSTVGEKKSKAFTEAYKRLNTAQKKAVDTIEGPVMVVAGPGTGKTTMLTLRIAMILKQTDVAPENILALTFTNSGVQAVRKKLQEYIGADAYRVGIYTFHSFADHVLTNYRLYFPQFEFSQVIDDLEKVKILETIIENGSYTQVVSKHDLFYSLRRVASAIDEIKQEGISPTDFSTRIPQWETELLAADEIRYKKDYGDFKKGDIKPSELAKVNDNVARALEIAVIYELYQQELAARNRYDFSDMILTVLSELETNENLRLDLQEQYQYLHVDEHQDTNEGQNKLIEFLTNAPHLDGRPNVFTVGDEKQSIYRFQGASEESFSYLQNLYKDVVTIELTENYRSTTPVLAAAETLIKNTVPDTISLSSNTNEQRPVTIGEFSDYKYELLYVVENIKAAIKEGVAPEEIAVIYRFNKHVEELKLLLQEANLPFTVLARDTLLDDKSITMLISLLRVVVDPYDNRALGRLLLANFLPFSPLSVTNTLREYAQKSRRGEVKGLIDVLRADKQYTNIITLIDDLKQFEANHSFAEFFKYTLHASGYLQYTLKRKDSETAMRKLDTLFSEVKRQSDATTSYSLADFISFVDAENKYGLNIEVKPTGRQQGVMCMTAHGSKGLEYERVYLINTTRNNWEKHRGFSPIATPIASYKGDLHDERRLFYVAMTRAKQHLTITSSEMDWHGKAMEPSQFINELDQTVTEQIDTDSFESSHHSSLVSFLNTSKANQSIFDVEYLRELFLQDNLSVTALNNYIECPIKYLFRNLIKLPDVYTPAQRYGQVLHTALEKFFTEAAEKQQIGTKAELLSHYLELLPRAGFSPAEQERYADLGQESLASYYEQHRQDWSVHVKLEEYVKIPFNLVNNEEITLSGMIDKIELLEQGDGGKVRVIDYKSGGSYSEKSKDQKAALERQLHFYSLLLTGYKDGLYQVAEAVLDFIEPNKKGQLEQKSVVTEPADLRDLEESIQNMATSILDGSFLKNNCQEKDCEACQLYNELEVTS